MVYTKLKVYIIVLNWNGWRDTIECLESLQSLDYVNYQIIVVDNNSSDDSMNKIKEWAEGRINVDSVFITHNNRKKPVTYIEYDRKTAETGGLTSLERILSRCLPHQRLILIQSGDNLGFAGGNNVGIRYALTKKDFDYIWLLNNDTVVKSDTLIHLVKRMQEDPNIGICGSTLLYYGEPQLVQAYGGAYYNKWLGIAKHIGTYSKFTGTVNLNEIERKMKYVIGASMLVSRDFLQTIGLMSEDYFLYFEEIDWAVRAKGQFKLGYAPESIVYHKEGATIGSSSDPNKKSITADYYAIKNRIVFTRKHYRWALPAVYCGLIGVALNRIRRKQWNRLLMIVKAILEH